MKRKHNKIQKLQYLVRAGLKLSALEANLEIGKAPEAKGLKYPKVDIPVINTNEPTTVVRDASIWNSTLSDVLGLYDARHEVIRSSLDFGTDFNTLGYELLKTKKALNNGATKIPGNWNFLGARYLKSDTEKGPGHISVWVSKKSFNDTINLFSERLFGIKGELLGGNFTKFANYINVGVMGSFGVNPIRSTYLEFNPAWDGLSVTTLDYLRRVNPKLADHFIRNNSSIFKMSAFGSVEGHIVPIKGTVLVLRSRNELRYLDKKLDVNTIYDAAEKSFVSSSNEIKLMPAGVKEGSTFNSVFGVHNIDTDEGLNNPIVTLHSQLLQRVIFNDPENVYRIVRRNVEHGLELLKTKEGFYSILSTEELDMDSLSTFEVDLARMLPITADKRLANSSLTMLERGLSKLVEFKVPGISVFPIPSSTLEGYNIAMSPAQAKIISKILRIEVKDGSILNIKRDPNVGTGYFPVTVNIRKGLNAIRGIVISRKIAYLLGADYDGDRISVTAPVFGGVKPVDTISPIIENKEGKKVDINNLIVTMNIVSTGDADIDNLVAATTGRRIGIADSQATELMFRGFRKASLAYATYIEQAIINSVKHIKDGIIDLKATFLNVSNFLGFNPFDKRKPILYKLFTGKLAWEDIIGYNPNIDPAVVSDTPVFKGVKDAVKTVGLRPWILYYNKTVEDKKWEILTHTAKYSICKIDPTTYKTTLPTRVVNGNSYVNYYKNATTKATPILNSIFKVLDSVKVGKATPEKISASRNKARDILRRHLDKARYALHKRNSSSIDAEFTLPTDVTYLHYVSIIIARLWANDALYPYIMLAFTTQEISAALAYLRAIYKMEQEHKELLGKVEEKLANARATGNKALINHLADQVTKGREVTNIMKNRPYKNGLDYSLFADELTSAL